MKKSDLKNFMIVRTGDTDYMSLLMELNDGDWMIIRSPSEEEWDLYDEAPIGLMGNEFNDELIYINDPALSIIEVYDSIPLTCPFDLIVEELYDEYKPKLLWKREPSKLSKSKLEGFATKEEFMSYVSSLVPPYFIVE